MESIRSAEAVLAKEWLLRSGIQNLEGKRKGGFNSWFNKEKDGYSYVYSEITGYGITTLLYLEKYFDDKEYLERAVAAADWLMDKALDTCGGVKTRDYYEQMEGSHSYSFRSNNIYAFDNGMVLYGIVNLYKRTRDKKYLDFAIKIANFMINEMARPDGSFFAIFNSETKEKEDTPWKWSSQSGSYHSKLALGFTDLFDVTKDQKYKDVVIDLCRSSMSFQDDSGRFVTSRTDKSTHLHPHSYSCEGLLYAGEYFGREDFVDSARTAVKWALDNQQDDGGVPKFFNNNKFVSYYRSDILAQVLRLGSILYSMGKLDDAYLEKLTRLHDRLALYQNKEDGPQVGGFFYGTTLDGAKRDHLNSWCTMFAVQALIMYESGVINNIKNEKVEHFI